MKHDDRRCEIESFYRRYNRCRNDREFGQLSEFVADNVQVNGQAHSLKKYIAGLRAVPDYRWELQHLLIDGDWISAHFHDTGTHRDSYLGVPATEEQSALRSLRCTGCKTARLRKCG